MWRVCKKKVTRMITSSLEDTESERPFTCHVGVLEFEENEARYGIWRESGWI